MISKKEQNELEIKRLALIEDKFKSLGKLLYRFWKDQEVHNFNSIMEEHHKEITKLKETKI